MAMSDLALVVLSWTFGVVGAIGVLAGAISILVDLRLHHRQPQKGARNAG
jgi:hypothetical protein